MRPAAAWRRIAGAAGAQRAGQRCGAVQTSARRDVRSAGRDGMVGGVQVGARHNYELDPARSEVRRDLRDVVGVGATG